MTSFSESVLRSVLDNLNKVNDDPKMKEIDHQIEVCETWLNDRDLIEISEDIYRLRVELTVIEEILFAIENHEDIFESDYLWRINGEPGKYNDASGLLLEICSRWFAMDILEDSPEFKTGISIDTGISPGNHINISPDGLVSVNVVTKAIEGIPEDQKTSAMNYRYSEDRLSTALLKFKNVEALKARQEKASSQIEELRKSSKYALLNGIREELISLREKRRILTREIENKV